MCDDEKKPCSCGSGESQDECCGDEKEEEEDKDGEKDED